ncbi:MAG: UDP-N-acetylmuramate--L-alanine ligase [Candidatus Pacebacteria bacterium]|nr:UDP-N-acetylmuramate--L-alanine ligase [Candidatus Paceibacterota bacterium]
MTPLDARNIFFVGIGGIGISAIARLFLLEGKQVFGSDMSETEITIELAKLGAQIDIGQGFALIPKDVDLIVYTTAIKHYDPSLMEEIFNSGITAKSYPEMLHLVTVNKATVAISGTHGKTTTTAMIAKVLIDAKKDPSVIVGSLLKDYKSNLIVGKGENFVVEACEYERSFLNINPKILVITNIEEDHLDYYKDISDIENAFHELSLQTTSVVVCDPHDPSVAHAINEIDADILDYTKYIPEITDLSVPGLHNIKNASAALAVAEYLGIDKNIAIKSLQKFSGTWRRLEQKETTDKGVIVYDDYAHHPTEIKASLEALRELYPKGTKKITIVFQPHLYSRTKALFEGFKTAFNDADEVYFLPIYFAREEVDPTVSSEILAQAVSKNVAGARAFSSFEEANEFFKNANLGSNDVFVTMGAGEAYKVGDNLAK